MAALYDRYAPDRYSLHDRGYLANLHPLELWLVAHLAGHESASFDDIVEASVDERQHVYEWLFKRSRRGQNTRIRILLEIDAFEKIHAQWAALGYPFDALVPSYATAIGVSGDSPAALADLIGVIVNGGRRHPTVRVNQLHFAEATPYETLFVRNGSESAQVMQPAVAEVLRSVLVDVVEDGTARRLQGAYGTAGEEGLVVGGKTGTGDNRYSVYGRGGVLRSSRSVSRTASFVFFLGDRHFGVITAYVPAPHARHYRFTSALPVQIMKNLAPTLLPHLRPAPADRCSETPRPH